MIVNKQDLVTKIVELSGLTKKDSENALNAITASIEGALKKGDKVQILGFGSFEIRERAARKGRNPATGAEINIPASKAPAFKAGKALKDAVK